MTLLLAEVTGPGTYPLSTTPPVRSIGTSLTNGQAWSSSQAGSAGGSVIVTSITATRIRGTFSATLGPFMGATGPVTMTNGAFDIGRQ